MPKHKQIPLPGAEAKPADENSAGKKARKKANGYEPPNLGKAIRLPVADFSDPDRPPVCLEVDFPIAPINALSNLEGNAGKPIYQMSKWWARRRSSVFRSLLISAATVAPGDPSQAAKRVWDHYYCNHQFDLPIEQRNLYHWEGPEIIYTFWAKHGPCNARGCNHRTPIFRSPVIAEKKLTAYFIPSTCPSCGHEFNIELGETRMAPGVERIVLDNEPDFTETSQEFAQLLKDYSKGNKEEKRSAAVTREA